MISLARHPFTGPGTGTLVIGLGNPLMTDDGIGLAALERLRESWSVPDDVLLSDGGTWGLRLLPQIEDAGRLLLLDAIEVDGDPGDVVVLERADIPRYLSHELSPHQVGLRDVLALAELRGRLPSETVAMGIQPVRVELGDRISSEASSSLDALVERAVERLRRWGHEVVRRPGARPGTDAAKRGAVPCTR